jgi:menaquinone-dependent protoporphyrinogen oxidase
VRILVTAASKYGSTAEIGQRIGEVLTARGHDVSVESPEGVEITGFDAVVLGSAVYAGHWLPAAKDLVARYAEELAARSTWLFSSGPVGDRPSPRRTRWTSHRYSRPRKATEHHVFAGKIDKQRLSFPERAIVVALRVRSGDFREWDEVESWAGEIADALGSRSASTQSSEPG